jgi:TetR/AcrR family transcriptional regulator of autoinduction and epiphytic fitness
LGLENYRRTVSEAKRASILKAARESFLKNGFSRAAMAEIARVADVSTATLYKHFSSKEELFEAVITRTFSQGPEPFSPVAQGQTVEQLLFRRTRDFLEAEIAQDLNALVRVVVAEVPSAPKLAADMYEHLIARAHRELARYFDSLVARGMLKPHDTDTGARLITGMLREFLMLPALFDSQAKLPANVDDIIREAIATYVARNGA